jgi:hypothetical protein
MVEPREIPMTLNSNLLAGTLSDIMAVHKPIMLS